MKQVNDTNVEGKKVLLRTDINLPIEDGRPQKTVRFQRYLDTIRSLSERGARVMVLAHQGRPLRKDFTSLKEHAELMAEELETDVKFVHCFFGPELEDTVESMENGDVALMENVRFLSEELSNASAKRHAQDFFVKELSDHFDIYVNDAFSAAHRSHGSMVGFTETLESYAGDVMMNELESCNKIRDELDNPLLVLGGEKPSDIIGMVDRMVDRVEKILLGGIPGELAMIIEGHDLGKKHEWIEENGFDSGASDLERILKEHGDKIVLPEDVTADSGDYRPEDVPEEEMIWDIGDKTAARYAEEIGKSDSVLMKGPMGAFDQGYEEGTKTVVDAIAANNGFTVLGGGHTSSLVQRFDHDFDEFDHVSIAGGAFVRYMSGRPLPAVDALNNDS